MVADSGSELEMGLADTECAKLLLGNSSGMRLNAIMAMMITATPTKVSVNAVTVFVIDAVVVFSMVAV